MIFEWRQGLIWIHFDLVYEGNPIKVDNCILDTGSATTAIDIDLIDFNYRKPSKIKRLFGIGGGTHEVIAQKIDKAIVDKIELKDIEIEFGDIKADLGINGFIGNDILGHFIITIDYVKQKVEFKSHKNEGSLAD